MFKVGKIIKTPLGEGIIKIIEGTSNNRKFWVELKGGAEANYKYIELDDYDTHGVHSLNIVHEKDCSEITPNNNIHWEMAITQEDGSTISQGSYDSLKEALKALSENPDTTAFIDNWRDAFPLGQSIRKDDI